MNKLIILLWFAFLTIQVRSSAVKSPRDLADEVAAQAQELESLVQGQILAAHNDLGNSETDFLTNNNNVLTQGGLSIQEEQEQINQQLQTIKELAAAINVEITACTDIREELMNRLPDEYRNLMRTCIFDKNRQEAQLLSNSRYIIDISINKVHNIEFQITQCRSDLNCLSPLVTEIELDKIRLPQNIRTEVQAFESQLTSLGVLVQECSDSNVSQYTADATALLGGIAECVNGIIDG